MSVKTLVNDPDFNKLSPQDKQAALSAVDPDFANIGVNEVDSVVSSIRGPGQEASVDNRGLLKKGWDALAVPEQKAQQFMNYAIDQSNKIPDIPMTGNLVRDFALNYPKADIQAITETAGKVIPPLVSRGSILTGLATEAAIPVVKFAAPAVRAIGRGMGEQLESASGIAPRAYGALKNAYNDAKLLFSPGKKAVSEVYQAAKEGEAVGAELLASKSKADFVEKAVNLAKEGKLNSTEALEARKELNGIKRTLPDSVFRNWNETLDGIAKQKFAVADAGHQRAVQAEAMRHILPQNKYGGASGFKTAMLLLKPGNTFQKLADLTLFSPAMQGLAATGLGVAERNIAAPLVSNTGAIKTVALNALRQALASRTRQAQ